MWDADVAVVGGGAAGLSLAARLSGLRDGPAVVLVDAPPGPLTPPERTWCYWEEPGGRWDDLLTARWDRLRITGADGGRTTLAAAPFQYKMLRSDRLRDAVHARLRDAGHARVEAVVGSVRDLPGGGAEVTGVDAAGRPVRLRARWAFDSRPPPRPRPARTALLQHFRGWFVRTAAPAFDPAAADLMDFRTPQPTHGLSFGYVLPLGPCEALVEYTEFGRAPLTTAAYDAALRHYTRDILGLAAPEVTATEQGVIPMTDARLPRRTGRAVFPLGAAGGATRPSTGYTFAATQRQTRSVARALGRGRVPLPPAPYPARSRAMDAVMLRALDTGRVAGDAFFTGLFRGVRTERLLRFLDGRTRWWEDALIGFSTPVGPMLRTAVELPRLRRALPAGAPPPPGDPRPAATTP
ncbi:lycopene cyclase family protein [Streptomyces sp. NPDC005805]|uniref:lycopene cyclase family protein n=1 Tax=Streptomyces sp. NPDC005805 TaxID=3157068 RepID=UPI0033EF303A